MDDDGKKYFFSYQEMLAKFQNKSILVWGIIGLVGLGIVLMISGNDKGNSPGRNIRAAIPINDYTPENSTVSACRQLEAELAQTLSSIKGVGRVRVELNLKTSSRKIWERQLSVSKRITHEQGVVNTEETNNDQIVIAKGPDGRDNPILKEELAPEIQGVIVVATGAGDVRIRELLMSTVMTALNLPAHRVMVIAGKNEGDEN